MRRSPAMSSLSVDDQRRLLDACAQMAQERAQIAAVLAGRAPDLVEERCERRSTTYGGWLE